MHFVAVSRGDVTRQALHYCPNGKFYFLNKWGYIDQSKIVRKVIGAKNREI